MQSQGISHAVQLEQWLMEGAYNKVLEARPQLPDPAYSYFMEKLLSTVRCSTFLLHDPTWVDSDPSRPLVPFFT